eukprot:Tbor_TRINITY_DN5766_c2_g3::TRINITY_DN5766_c2_g3_i1::g.19730::m.19730/K03842/ALG1; beta-1,4-mannosyltransferase
MMLIILLGPVLATVLCFLALVTWDITFFLQLIYYVVTTNPIKKPSSCSSHSADKYDGIQQQRNEKKKKIIVAKEKYAARKKYYIGNIRIVQRAVVIVGGDFARSPRMMYHATSLSDRHTCGHLFDEIVLVGYDEGNLLAEPLRSRSKEKGVTKLVMSDAVEVDSGDDYLDESALLNINVDTTSCIMKKVEVPPSLSYWIVGAVYRTIMQTVRLIITLIPLCTITSRRENVVASCVIPSSQTSSGNPATEDYNGQSHKEEYLGQEIQIVMTSLVICQTPPAIPFLPILQLMVRVVGPVISYVRSIFLMMCGNECGWICNNEIKHDYDCGQGEPIAELIQNTPTNMKQNEHQQNTVKFQKSFLSSYFTPRLIVDWHNMGYTLLEIDQRPLWMIIIYRFAEKYFGFGDINFTVSQAMKCTMSEQYEFSCTLAEGSDEKKDEVLGELEEPKEVSNVAPISTIKKNMFKCNFNFPGDMITVVHDRAPAFFSPCSRETFIRDVILPGFGEQLQSINEEENRNVSIEERLILSKTVPEWVFKNNSNHARTHIKSYSDNVNMENSREIRGRIIVSSTSWTSDDDYTMLLDALLLLNLALIAQNGSNSRNLFDRHLWLVITGKGPTRKVFEKQLAEEEKYQSLRDSPFIRISTIYFKEYAQYAKMLGGSDIGLSLHGSSSGFDLPMKCVDMLGAGLPVLALYYPAILELVDERGGWLFKDAEELGDILITEVMGLLPSDLIASAEAEEENTDLKSSSDSEDTSYKSESNMNIWEKISRKQSNNSDEEYDFCGYTPRNGRKKKFEEVVVVSERSLTGDHCWSKCEEELRKKSKFVAENQGMKWSESWEKHVLPCLEGILQHNSVA